MCLQENNWQYHMMHEPSAFSFDRESVAFAQANWLNKKQNVTSLAPSD